MALGRRRQCNEEIVQRSERARPQKQGDEQLDLVHPDDEKEQRNENPSWRVAAWAARRWRRVRRATLASCPLGH